MEKETKKTALIIGAIIIAVCVFMFFLLIYVSPPYPIEFYSDIPPNIIVWDNDTTNTLIIVTTPLNQNWSNINITLSGLSGNTLHYEWINLTRWPDVTINNYGIGGQNAPASWGTIDAGDTITIPTLGKNTTVVMRWIPTNTRIGTWTFNQ